MFKKVLLILGTGLIEYKRHPTQMSQFIHKLTRPMEEGKERFLVVCGICNIVAFEYTNSGLFFRDLSILSSSQSSK